MSKSNKVRWLGVAKVNSFSLSAPTYNADKTITVGYSISVEPGAAYSISASGGSVDESNKEITYPAISSTVTKTVTLTNDLDGSNSFSDSVQLVFTPSTYSGTISYTTASRVSDDGNDSYANLQAGAGISYSVVLTAQNGYVFSDGSSSKTITQNDVALSVPSSGGNVVVNLSSYTVSKETFSGKVIFTLADDVSGSTTSVAYSGLEEGDTAPYSITLSAYSGFEFSDDGTTSKTITEALVPTIVPNGGGDIVADLSGYTVDPVIITVSGTLTYLTARNVSTTNEASRYENVEPGDMIFYSVTLEAASGYAFADGLTKKTLSDLDVAVRAPAGGGNVNIDLTSYSVRLSSGGPLL